MTLVQTRQKLVEMTGYYNLVVNTSAWADNGANYFINAGQKLLDRMVTHRQGPAEMSVSLLASTKAIEVSNLRALHEIVAPRGSYNHRLLKRSLMEIRALYPQSNLDDVPDGDPQYWTLLPRASTQVTDTRLVRIMPSPPTNVTLLVYGMFYTPRLTLDADTSYWTTIDEGHLLVLAAAYVLETYYRNRSGMQDRMFALQEALTGLEKDVVEEEIYRADVQRNSF